MKSSIRPMLLLAGVALLVAGLLGPALGAGVPLPRPRPDRNAQPGPPPTAPGQETQQQQLVRTGFPDNPGGDSLINAANGAPDPTKLGTTPQKVSLAAQAADKGARITDGLVWRVYGTKPDKSGQLPMIAKSEQAAPVLTLRPGDYVVHVAYGRAQASDTLSVGNAATNKAMVLDAGGLKLNAAISGDIAIPINLLHFDVFTAGATDADRTLVAEKVGPNDLLTLNAGTYHVVSYFGDVNAVVRADLRVEPGQLTDATLYHKAAQVSFKLVSDAAGEAIADVDWTVKSSDGQTIFSNTGTFPGAVLQEGDYLVLAKRGGKVYSKQLHVQAGKPQDISVLTTGN